MSKYVRVEAIREKLMEYIGLTNGFDRAFAETEAIDIVKCSECRHRTECISEVVFSTHRGGNSHFRSVDYCSLGEREYKYGMRLRGFSIGCQPKKGFIERTDDMSGKYYDILAYDRRLTEQELADYELDYLGKETE